MQITNIRLSKKYTEEVHFNKSIGSDDKFTIFRDKYLLRDETDTIAIRKGNNLKILSSNSDLKLAKIKHGWEVLNDVEKIATLNYFKTSNNEYKLTLILDMSDEYSVLGSVMLLSQIDKKVEMNYGNHFGFEVFFIGLFSGVY